MERVGYGNSAINTIYTLKFLRVHSNCLKMMFDLLKVNNEFLAFIRIQLEDTEDFYEMIVTQTNLYAT